MSSDSRSFAIVPAAGRGTRFDAAIPKQYLPLAGRTVLEWSVDVLDRARWIEQVLVVVAAGDTRAAALLGGRSRVRVLDVGGATRRDSVLNAMRSLTVARPDDWVLVHDAARPGLTAASLERLRESLADEPVGGLLAQRVADTVKRAGGQGPAERVAQTLERDGLWLAQTPQMFRYGPLLEALERHASVTDEAAAIEAAGLVPRLVEGPRSNFKVTTVEDLEMMQRLLAAADATDRR